MTRRTTTASASSTLPDGLTIEIGNFSQYPTLDGLTVAERQAIANGAGVKNAPVWHDYVAGTDSANALSKFTVKIEMKEYER